MQVLVAGLITRRIYYHTTVAHNGTTGPSVALQVDGKLLRSFVWRLLVGMAIVPIGLVLCLTIVGAIVGIPVLYLGTLPLQRLFKAIIMAKVEATNQAKAAAKKKARTTP